MRTLVTVVFASSFWVNIAFAAEPADARAAIDRSIAEGLKEVHNRGADLHNAGDMIGAWRMYQGALLAIKPLMAHRADVQNIIDEGMKRAETVPTVQRSVFLSKTIIETRKKIVGEPSELHKPRPNDNPQAPANPNPGIITPPGPPISSPSSFPNSQTPPAPAPVLSPTLWDRLGGEKRVEKVVDEWIALSAADPKVNLNRGGQFKLEGEALATVKRRFIGYISSVSEGTLVYSGRSMKDSHQGMNITAAEFDAMVGHLKSALKKENIADVESGQLIKKIEETKNDMVTK